jgi:hypothetical protein
MGRAVLSSRPTTGLERLAAVPSGPYCLNCSCPFTNIVIDIRCRVPILLLTSLVDDYGTTGDGFGRITSKPELHANR